MFRGEILAAATSGPFFVRADRRGSYHLEMHGLDEAAKRRGDVPRRRIRCSNGGMPNPHDADIERRLTDLEVKASFSEDLVDHLNDLVARQQAQIELLIREVGKLKERAPDTGGDATRDPRDELPPHY
jgi:SlyX protein